MATYTTTFSLGNETPISEGGVWSTGVGFWTDVQVLSGTAQAATLTPAGGAAQARLETPVIGANQYSRGVMGNESTGGSIHCYARIQAGTGRCYACRTNVGAPGLTEIGILEDTGSAITWTSLGPQATPTPAIGDSVEVRIVGTTLVNLIRGEQFLSFSDATLTTGQPGFGMDCGTATANQTWDSWEGGDLPPISMIGMGATFNTTSGTKTVTSTPSVGDLIVIITAHSANASATTPTDNNADGNGTYTQVESRVKSTSADRMQIFIRNSLIGSATSTIFTHAPGTTSGGGLSVVKITGMAAAGAAAKVQSGGADNLTSAAPSMTWTGGGSASGLNPVISAVFNTVNSAGQFTKPTAFDTKVTDLAYTTTANGLGVASDNEGFTGTTVAWTVLTSSACCIVALELAAPVAAASLVLPIQFPRALLVR
jgi:hypothetical protein